MKKQLPLALGIVVGVFAVLEFYVPSHGVGQLQERLLDYGLILAAAAYVLGGINVLQVNWPKIRRREADWHYKAVLLGGALVMGLAGVAWHSFGGERPSGTVTLHPGDGAGGPAYVRVLSADDDAMIVVDGAPPVTTTEWRTRDAQEIEVASGRDVSVRVFMPPLIKGYDEFKATVHLEPGQTAVIESDLVLLWGKEGRVYTWLYDHVFDPCNSTMFALLAFFIASAAFRAFRARNTEAALLLGSAILVMIGRAPMGALISDVFPDMANWILDVPNNAGRRAIMMGAALGAVVTGLRVILGLERSHLGSD